MNARNLLFPALRCRMGDTFYYATSLSFRDVVVWIKPTDEIHKSVKLSRWIQRRLVHDHSGRIAEYLKSQRERFFNAIVVGIYGGAPQWAPLSVTVPEWVHDITVSDDDRENLESSIGILSLSGDEKLFAIDGQHRVEGIKKSLEGGGHELETDEIVALFVGHDTTTTGEQRTRRLFTTLNKTAKRVSDADRVALDEDDGFAVVTRRLLDEFALFKRGKIIAFNPTASLSGSDDQHLTTIISLYSQCKDIYSDRLTRPVVKKAHFSGARPTDKALDQVYKAMCEYWRAMKDHISEVGRVLAGRAQAGDYRKSDRNHLLLRPVGQRAFAGATGVLIERGEKVRRAVERLSKVDLWIHSEAWHEILWDPVQNVMLKSPVLAETWLLRQIGENGRSDARQRKLDETIKRKA
jgi:DNA sulfur modification protein DndB